MNRESPRPTIRNARRVTLRGRRAALPSLLALLLAATLAGCAAQWSLRSSEAAVALQWPFAPAPAKVIFLRSLTGLRSSRTALGTLRSVAYGAGPAEGDAFVLPVATVTGADGRLAVADLGRRCVHLFLPGEQRYLRLVGPAGAPLVSPVGLAFGEHSQLWVADSGSGRLLAYDAAGALLETRDRIGEERLLRPTGLAYDPRGGTLYVVDTLASRIHALGKGGVARPAFGHRGEAVGELNYPTHAFWSAASGELYVTDALNFRIAVFAADGRPLRVFGRHGDGSGDLAMPKGVAVDADGVVYVADALFDNVQLFSREGEFLLTLGARGVDPGQLWLPGGLFINDSGELYVSDTYNRRVQVFRVLAHYATAP